MSWSLYSYLFVSCVGAIALFVLAYRNMPLLATPNTTIGKAERIGLALIVLLGLVTVYGTFYLGTFSFAYSDVGSDTLEQYIPYYLNMLDSIRQGTLGAWIFQYGLGTSFMSYQSWTLDPFNLILVPLGLIFGNDDLAMILVVVQSLKIISVAAISDHLLLFFCKTPAARITGSTLLAFGGYLILWGQHYWIGSIYVMAILMLLLLELLNQRWTVIRFACLSLATTLCVVMSTYSGFMVLLFSAIYAMLRSAHFSIGRGAREFAKRFGILALPVACGLLISMVTLVPYATLILGESSRVSGSSMSMAEKVEAYATGFVPLRWVPAILSRLLGSSLISSGEPIPTSVMAPVPYLPYVNVYEIITLGLSGSAVILLALFLTQAYGKGQDKKDKALITVAMVLMALYCVNLFLPSLFNAMVGPKYRSSFAVAIPACLAMSVAIDRITAGEKIPRIPLAISSLLSLGVAAWSLRHTVNGRLACLAYLLGIIVFVGGLAALEFWPQLAPRPNRARHSSAPTRMTSTANLALALICTATMGMLLVDGFFTTNNRQACTPQDFPAESNNQAHTDTLDALAYLKDNDGSFWRVEKTYSDWTSLDDSLVQGYRGVSSYNSTLDSDVENFYNQLWPTAIAGDIAYQSFNNDANQPQLLDTLGVKYLLTHGELDWPQMAYVTSFGSVNIYRNINVSSVVTVRPSTITESEVEQFADPADRRMMLGSSIIVPDEVGMIASASPTDSVSLADAFREFAANVPEDELAQTLPYGQSALDAVNANTGYLPPSTAYMKQISGGALSGALFSSGDSVACLAIPHTSGWKVLVDGQEVDTFRANYGFIGFKVSSGYHTIEASFSPAGLKTGTVLAAIGALTALASCVVGAKLNGCRRLSIN